MGGGPFSGFWPPLIRVKIAESTLRASVQLCHDELAMAERFAEVYPRIATSRGLILDVRVDLHLALGGSF